MFLQLHVVFSLRFCVIPKCSLYPPASYSFPWFSLPRPPAPLVSSHLGRFLAVLTPSLLTMLTKTLSPQCFPFFFHERSTLSPGFVLFYLEACSRLVLLLLGASYAKVRRVFVGTQLSVDSESRSLNFSLCTYIYLLD